MRVTDAGRHRRCDRDGHDRGISGWEFVHIAVDDYSRLAYAEVLADEKATTAIGFLRRALAFFVRHGIHVERILTDNGSAYISTLHAIACRQLGPARMHSATVAQASRRSPRATRRLRRQI